MKQNNGRLLIGVGLILTSFMLALNLTEYMMVSQKIRQYTCEVTHLQGVVDTAKFIDKLAAHPQNNKVAPILNELSRIIITSESAISPGECVDVEITYLEVQWFRLKQAMQALESK